MGKHKHPGGTMASIFTTSTPVTVSPTSDGGCTAAGPLEGVAEDKGQALLRFASGYRLEGFERSIKLSEGTLLQNRFLFGIDLQIIPPEQLSAICGTIRMPEEYIKKFAGDIKGADTLHFGFEQNEQGNYYKAYLEYWQRFKQAMKSGSSEPFLLHISYKWGLLHSTNCTVARYVFHPGLTSTGILQRVEKLDPNLNCTVSRQFTMSVMQLALARKNAAPMYLEVSELGNSRMSFDLNFYGTELRLSDVRDILMTVFSEFSIPHDAFVEAYEPIKDRKLGHVAGGVSRSGMDFLTIYYEDALHRELEPPRQPS